MSRSIYVAFGLAWLGALSFLPALAQSGNTAPPRYRVDASWPKQLPNNWIMGQVGGLSVDNKDHIWVLQRPRTAADEEKLGAAQNPPRTICCTNTPSLLEFDTNGNVIRSWDKSTLVTDWPKSEHAVYVDKEDNVWISGSGPVDRHVLKLSVDGKQLMEIGHPSDAPTNNQDTSMLGHPAGIDIDEAAHEIYISDGYLNSRIVVYDTDTGKFKRGWGAYGVPLDQISNDKQPRYTPNSPPAKQFGIAHCVRLSNDGLVYVCDRLNDRIQVFTKQGKFLKEFSLRPATTGGGSVYTLTFSHDKQQNFLLVADGGNNLISILRRTDGVEVGQIGHLGRNAGQFDGLHQVALDSKGNLYVGEAGLGHRVQKFVLQGRK